MTIALGGGFAAVPLLLCGPVPHRVRNMALELGTPAPDHCEFRPACGHVHRLWLPYRKAEGLTGPDPPEPRPEHPCSRRPPAGWVFRVGGCEALGRGCPVLGFWPLPA